MKNLRNWIKNPEIQLKKSKIQILSCKTYLRAGLQESSQESAKNPKLKNDGRIKTSQSLVGQGICQESRNPKSFQKNLPILESVNALLAYVGNSFFKNPTAPPPLHGG